MSNTIGISFKVGRGNLLLNGSGLSFPNGVLISFPPRHKCQSNEGATETGLDCWSEQIRLSNGHGICLRGDTKQMAPRLEISNLLLEGAFSALLESEINPLKLKASQKHYYILKR